MSAVDRSQFPLEDDPLADPFASDYEGEPLDLEALEAAEPIVDPAPPSIGGALRPIESAAVAPQAFGFNPVGELVADAEAAMGEAPLPRIAIHVFCERADTFDSAQRAAADRRLNRATTQVRMGGIPVALETYRSESTPSLVIVESLAAAPVMLAQLEQLSEVCDAGTKVVVIGSANDIQLYRELMRRGVSEYLVSPIQPLQLIRGVATLYADPHAPFVGRSIAFVGARGGAGSSTLAHNTAYAITERLAANAVIVDFDLPFGTAGLDFNQEPLQGVVDALGQPDRLDPVLLDRMMARCTDRLSLFAAPATLDQDYDLSPEAFDEVAQKIRTTAPYVVLDLPHLWSAWMRRMLISSDEVVVVATPDLASLRNAKNMIDLIKGARPNDAPPRVVLNQVGVPGRPEIPLKDFTAALGASPALIIPFDAKLFGHAANNGQMILETGAKSKAAEGFQHLAQLVTRRELATVAGASEAKGAAKNAAKATAKAEAADAKPAGSAKSTSLFAKFLKR